MNKIKKLKISWKVIVPILLVLFLVPLTINTVTVVKINTFKHQLYIIDETKIFAKQIDEYNEGLISEETLLAISGGLNNKFKTELNSIGGREGFNVLAKVANSIYREQYEIAINSIDYSLLRYKQTDGKYKSTQVINDLFGGYKEFRKHGVEIKISNDSSN